MAYMLQDSGPFGYLVLAVGVLAIPFAFLVALAIGGMKWRVPASLGWLGLTLAMVLGAVGTGFGQYQANQAVLLASPEMKQVLVAAGLSVALYTSLMGFFMAAVGLYGAAWATALPAPVLPGPDPKIDVRGLLYAMGGAFVGLLVALGITLGGLGYMTLRDGGALLWVLPFVALFGTVPPLLASLRVAKEDTLHQSRMAGLRGATLVAAALSVGLFGECFRLFGVVQAFKAVALASPDLKAELMQRGIEVAGYSSTVGWAFALVPFLAGFLGMFPVLGRADDRVGMGAAVAGAQVLVILGTMFYIRSSITGVFGSLGL